MKYRIITLSISDNNNYTHRRIARKNLMKPLIEPANYTDDNRIKIFKGIIENVKNTRPEEFVKSYSEIGKLIFKENASDIKKYQTMIYLSSFDYIAKDKGVYLFATKNEKFKPYLEFYNKHIFGWPENVKINIIYKDEVKG